MSTSAIWPLQQALDRAIRADTTLANLLVGDKVYSLLGPPTDGLLEPGKGYVLLSRSDESNWPMFDAAGLTGNESLSVWSGDLHKRTVAQIVAEMKRVLDDVPLTLGAPLHWVTGELNVIDLGLDPQTLKYSRAMLTYTVMSYA